MKRTKTRLVLALTLCTVSSTVLGAIAIGCAKEESYPPAGYPPYGTAPTATQVAYPPQPGAAPPATQPTATTPPPATPATTPAFGFFCASDQDPQCLFGRCVQGRCGGCADASQCKPGSVCAATPFGQACVWSGTANAPPPTPTAAPPPTATPPATTPPAVPPQPGDAYANARARCVQQTNAYRAQVAAPAVERRPDRESCGDGQAASDASTGRAHGAFGQCGERAQNECPGWPGPPEVMIDHCLKAMFDEGPGEGSAHGHYNNMTSSKYTGVACGFYTKPDGSLWVVQNFFP